MGAWIWDTTIRELNALNYTAYSLTLSGLGSKQDVADITLETHITDVINFIDEYELENVILVGHSYSGLVAGQVADRIADKIKHVIYLNAFLPETGKSLIDSFGEAQAKLERQSIEENSGLWLPPTSEGLANEPDISLEQQQWLSNRLVPHPGRTVTDPAKLHNTLADQQATYIACRMPDESSEDIEAKCNTFGWNFQYIEAGHWAMLSSLDELIDVMTSVN